MFRRKTRRKALADATWIQTVQLANPLDKLNYERIQPGEAAVLALAEERDAHLVIIDERKARQKAKEIGLPVKGSVGVLLEAKENGLIELIKPLLTQMQTKRNLFGEIGY